MIRSKNYLKTQYTGVNSSTSVEQQESPIYRPPSQTVSNQPNFNYSLYPAEDSITSSEAKRSEFLPPLRPRQSSYYEQKLEPFESSHSRNEEYLSQPPSHQHGDRHYKQDQKSDSFHPRDIIPQEYQQLPHYETYPMQPQLTGNWEPDTKDSISSNSVPSTETKRQTTGSMVDHTYRDFSGVPPSSEDLERYENKKGEYNRRIKEKNDVKAKPPAPAPVPPVKAAKDDEKSTSLTKKRGRGNKANRQGKDSFVGFMGTNFPARLHDLLAHENDINDIITWLPHGRSWIVRDKKEFLKRVAPSHFQISKFESFTRQVNGWGFKRITQGPDMNSYYHELFLQGMPHLIQWMKRVSPSGQGRRKIRADPKDEPNFYEIGLAYPVPDYYKENGGARVTMPVIPLPTTNCRQITPILDNHGDNGRARSYSDAGENPDPRVYRDINQDRARQYNSFGRENEIYDKHHMNRPAFPTLKRIEPNEQGGDAQVQVLRDMNIDEFWTNVPSYEHQQRHRVVTDYGSDMHETEELSVSLAKNSGTEPVATKNHWQCFYDALADNDPNCPNIQEDQSGDTDFEDPDFIHDITPVPIHYPSQYHSPSNVAPAYHNNYEWWNNPEREGVSISGEREPKKMKIESVQVMREQHLTANYEYPEPSVVTFL